MVAIQAISTFSNGWRWMVGDSLTDLPWRNSSWFQLGRRLAMLYSWSTPIRNNKSLDWVKIKSLFPGSPAYVKLLHWLSYLAQVRLLKASHNPVYNPVKFSTRERANSCCNEFTFTHFFKKLCLSMLQPVWPTVCKMKHWRIYRVLHRRFCDNRCIQFWHKYSSQQ
jgi:hypothetical protein